MSKRWKINRRRKCNCGAYYFPHRKGGGACIYGAKAEYYLAIRSGEDKKEALQHLAVHVLEFLYPWRG